MAAVRLLPSDKPAQGRHRRRIPLPSDPIRQTAAARDYDYEVAR
jgi:hypothetical protein